MRSMGWFPGRPSGAAFVGVRVLVVGCALISLTAGAGCKSKHAPDAARRDPLRPYEYPQIAIHEDMRRRVMVHEVHENEGPPLSVRVTLRNRTDDEERFIQYRFFFLDETGGPERADPDWHFLKLPPRTLVYASGNALDSAATEWRMEIRPAR